MHSTSRWLVLSLLVSLAAAARAQVEAAVPAPTVVVEHGAERITVCLVPGGEPLVFVDGAAVPTTTADGEHTAHAGEYTVHVKAPDPAVPLSLYYRTLLSNNVAKAFTKGLDNGKWRLAHLDRPHIGVQVGSLPQALADHLGLDPKQCVLILSATAGGPADKAGIQANDILLAIDGKEGVQEESLSEAVAKKKVGDPIKLDVLRRGARQEVDVVVEATIARRIHDGLGQVDSRFTYVVPQDFRFKPVELAKGGWHLGYDRNGVLGILRAGASGDGGETADSDGAAGGNDASRADATGGEADTASLHEELRRIRALLDRLQKQIEKQGDGR